MKKKKPKITPPRLTWKRKPMTQVKSSDKIYKREKRDWRDEA